jgi:soluble lytic murein transglycosylase-like protein
MNRHSLARLLPLGIAGITLLAVCAATTAVTRPEIAAAMIAGNPIPSVAPLFTPQVLAWEADIARWAQESGLDPNLVATVMQIESCGDPWAVSPSGARGLFQVMPYHFSEGEDMFDPETNAMRGLAYLGESLYLSAGDIRRALAGYNGGHGVIGSDPSQWTLETQRYSYWGEGIYNDAAGGRTTSPRLEDWLAAGGETLCEKASRSMTRQAAWDKSVISIYQ